MFHEAVTVGLEHGYADAVLLQTFVSSYPRPVVPLVVVDAMLVGAQLGAGEQQAISIARAQGMLLRNIWINPELCQRLRRPTGVRQPNK